MLGQNTLSMVITLILSFLASFLFIGLKSWQQLNVFYRKYFLIIPTSLAMALAEVFIINQVVQIGYNIWLVIVIGLGSGLGCIVATYLHHKFIANGPKRSSNRQNQRIISRY